MLQLRSSVYVGRMKSATFTIVPLSTEIADKARSAAKAGKRDHATITVDDENTMPCRHCLRWANSGAAWIDAKDQAAKAALDCKK